MLKNISDEALLRKTQKLANLERRITVRLLKHLEEVERRRLHLERGYSSIYDYLIRGLGYSGGAAHRRVQAMEVCCDLPEVANKIESGQVNLTQAMQLQGYFEREEKVSGQTLAPEIKRALFSQVEGLSTRETKRVLAALSPEASKPDRQRAISGDLTEITFAADQELLEMLDRIKDLVAHSHPNPSLLELFKLMAKKTLEKIDPLERAKRARPRRPRTKPVPTAAAQTPAQMPPAQTPAPGIARRPDAATLHALYQRDQGACQYVDPKSGRKCGAKRALEVEHKIPYAMGGKTELENLELLCRSHNGLRAIEVYGAKKMSKYLGA